MKFSVVIATYNREALLKNLLRSLQNQTCSDMEIIIIDQNRDDKVNQTINLFPEIAPATQIIKSDSNNLSLCRNRGIEASKGELIFFPDDDATIPEAFFEKVVARFEKDGDTDFISLPLLECESSSSKDERDIFITERNANLLTTASSVIYRRKVIDNTGPFDVQLGLGGEFEAAEDLDYVLRVLYKGFHGYYHQGTFVVHNNPLTLYDVSAAERAYRYNRGYGACVKKHWKRYNNASLLRQSAIDSLKNIMGMIRYFLSDPGRSRYNLLSLRGKVDGFRRYR